MNQSLFIYLFIYLFSTNPKPNLPANTQYDFFIDRTALLHPLFNYLYMV